MTETDPQPNQPDVSEEFRRHALARASEINGKLLARLAAVADDLDAGNYLPALERLDGIERQIETMRSFLLLLR